MLTNESSVVTFLSHLRIEKGTGTKCSFSILCSPSTAVISGELLYMPLGPTRSLLETSDRLVQRKVSTNEMD